MSKVLLVGKNSFLAGRFLSLARDRDRYLPVTHREALDRTLFEHVDCVINFALDPRFRSRPYAPQWDFDAALAAMAARADAHYIMLSSRTVYGSDAALNAREASLGGEAASLYGRNKRIAERRLTDLLGDRVTLLRTANVIGDEQGLGRRTFMALTLDGLAAQGKIVLDINPSVRRDFLPIGRFAAILEAVARNPRPGPLNVGSGLPLAVGSVAGWLIEGFGEGTVSVVDDRIHDEFYLDVGLLRQTYGFHIDEAEIADDCRRIGASLRRKLAAAGGPAQASKSG